MLTSWTAWPTRFKACLESHHNLKHNELGWLPAQTGLDRETRPEFTVGILEDDDDLVKAMVKLAETHPARAAQLRCRTLDYHSGFLPILMETYRIVNERDWHRLEGWDAIPGNVEMQYRLAPTADWMTEADFARLPVAVQQVVLLSATEDRRYVQPRRLSPADVQRRERGGLVKLPDWAICEILVGSDPDLWHAFSRDLKVSGAYFNVFRDAQIAPEGLLYESRVTTHAGKLWQLPDDTYLVVVNPFNPGQLYVHDARQRFLGTALLDARARDAQTLHAKMGRAKERVAELNAPLIARHKEDIKAEIRRLEANAELMSGAASADAWIEDDTDEALSSAMKFDL